MRYHHGLAALVVSGALAACAPANVLQSPPSPPVRALALAPEHRAEILSVRSAVRRAFFGPDGRVYVPFGERVVVAAPDDLAHGEILPFRGTLFPRGARLFGLPAGESAERPSSTFVELDWRLREVRHFALPEGESLISLTPSGAYATIATYSKRGGPGPVKVEGGLYRTADFSLVLAGVHGPSNHHDGLGTLETSPDERFVVAGAQVVDVERAKVVFSHRSLERSTRVFEGDSLHWLFHDLLETVDLASGKRAQSWLPCEGASAGDARRGVIYTACHSGLARTTFSGGAPSTAILPYPSALEPAGLVVEESGRVVVSKAVPRENDPYHGFETAPALALSPGAAALEKAEGGNVTARRAYVEAGAPGQSRCRAMLGDGKPAPMAAISCDATVSPDGRTVVTPFYGGVEVFSLPDGKSLGTLGGSMIQAFNGKLSLDDGELVATRGEEPHEVSARIRLGPGKKPGSGLRVRMAGLPKGNPVNVLVDHESVVLESAAGKPITQFPFEHYYTGKAILAGEEIVVHLESPGVAFGQPHHCKRDGHCEPILAGGTVLAFDGAEALGAVKVEGAFAFVRVDLRTSAVVTIPTPKEVTSAAAVSGGWVLGLSGGTLAHVSRSTGAIDHVSESAVAFGLPIVGAVGDRVAFAELGPDVVVVDAATFAVTDRYLLANKGYLHVDRAGRYSISGETAALESFVLCSDGHHLTSHEACRQTPAPRR